MKLPGESIKYYFSNPASQITMTISTWNSLFTSRSRPHANCTDTEKEKCNKATSNHADAPHEIQHNTILPAIPIHMNAPGVDVVLDNGHADDIFCQTYGR